MPKAHPADPIPTAERGKPRPHERRKRRLRAAPPDPEKYPNLQANRALDRALHIHRAMALGATREQAIADTDEHLGTSNPPPTAPTRPAHTGARKPRARTHVQPLD